MEDDGRAESAWTSNAISRYGTVRHGTAHDNTRQHSTAQHSTAQHNTTQHNTTQHSTAQLSGFAQARPFFLHKKKGMFMPPPFFSVP